MSDSGGMGGTVRGMMMGRNQPTYQTQPVNMGMSGQTGAPMQGNYGRGMQNSMGGQGIAGLPRMPVSAGQPYQPQGGMPQARPGAYQGGQAPGMMQSPYQYGMPNTTQYVQQQQDAEAVAQQQAAADSAAYANSWANP